MTDLVYLNKDKTAVVPEWTIGKKWQVPRKEAAAMGLLDSEDKPLQTRRVSTETHTTASEPVRKAVQRRRSKRK